MLKIAKLTTKAYNPNKSLFFIKSYSTTMSDSVYHKKADFYLENLTEYLEDLGDAMESRNYDVLFNVSEDLILDWSFNFEIRIRYFCNQQATSK